MLDVLTNCWKDKSDLKNEGDTLRKMTEFKMLTQKQHNLLGHAHTHTHTLLRYDTEKD